MCFPLVFNGVFFRSQQYHIGTGILCIGRLRALPYTVGTGIQYFGKLQAVPYWYSVYRYVVGCSTCAFSVLG